MLELRKGRYSLKQAGAERPKLGIIDLAAQATARGQCFGHCQELLAVRRSPLAAAQQHRSEVMNALEAQPSLEDAVEARQFDRARQPAATGREIGRKSRGKRGAIPRSGAGEGGEMGTQTRPFEQLEGVLKNGARG